MSGWKVHLGFAYWSNVVEKSEQWSGRGILISIDINDSLVSLGLGEKSMIFHSNLSFAPPDVPTWYANGEEI